jgi:hypothetical protein
MLVHGGPGTGKTFFVEKVLQYARFHGVNFIVGAQCASAASILPMGETLHSIIGLGMIQEDKGGSTKEVKLKPLSGSKLEELQVKYQNAKFIVIDEISMVSVCMLSYISDRFKEIMASTEDFGGLGNSCISEYFLCFNFDDASCVRCHRSRRLRSAASNTASNVGGRIDEARSR